MKQPRKPPQVMRSKTEIEKRRRRRRRRSKKIEELVNLIKHEERTTA
jgi:hypothetical protein